MEGGNPWQKTEGSLRDEKHSETVPTRLAAAGCQQTHVCITGQMQQKPPCLQRKHNWRGKEGGRFKNSGRVNRRFKVLKEAEMNPNSDGWQCP